MDGRFFIGQNSVSRPAKFAALSAATGKELATEFSISTGEDVAAACMLADDASDCFRELAPDLRAQFLEEIALRIEALGEALIECAMEETGLPQARLTGERGRTVGQLRLFAQVLRQGRWMRVTLDPPLPDRVPLPRSDLRMRHIALGPVAVFGASNFPLAFSVAGGDTASALAAGCPVVVKAHPAHPGTSQMVAGAIQAAVAACDLPDGVFSLLQGPSNELGAALVGDPRIKAVGFTGSRSGGLALVAIAQARPEPIPVYAEMSSINPVILLPAALANRADALGQAFAGSLNMGAGQFCTNPGIVIATDGPDLHRFIAAATHALEQSEPQTMLTAGIHNNYRSGVAALSRHPAVTALSGNETDVGPNQCQPSLFSVSARDFIASPELSQEVFGATSTIVRCETPEEIIAVLYTMEGQLTATLQMDEADLALARTVLPVLERKVGRILANGWPTGVEVSYAMVHGGPFPATSDARTTSVGATAIDRFLRPVCYQDLPGELLPEALRDANPLRLPRFIS